MKGIVLCSCGSILFVSVWFSMSQMLVFTLLILALVVPVVGMIALRLVAKRLPTVALHLGAGILFTIAIVCVLFLSRSNVASLSVGHLTLLLPVTGPSTRVVANVPPPPRPTETDTAPIRDSAIATDDNEHDQNIPSVLITPVITPTSAMTMTETQQPTPTITPTITSAVTSTTSITMTIERTPTVSLSPTTTVTSTTSTTVLTPTPQSAPVLSPTLTATPALTPTTSLTATQERIPGVASTPVVTPALEPDMPTAPMTRTTTLTSTTAPEASPMPEDTANTASNTYVVQLGDTFSTIAEALDVDMQALLQANDMDMEEAEQIQPGQELLIP